MRKLLLFITATFITLTANAQWNFGLKGGVSLSDMSFNNELLSSNNRTGFFIGPTMKYTPLIMGFGFDASVFYDEHNVNVDYSGYDILTLRQKQIALPVNLTFSIGIGTFASVFVSAGPQVGFNISNENDPSLVEKNLEWRWKTSNLSANFGGGVIVLNHFQLSANYNLGLGKTGEFEIDKLSEAKANDKLHSWQIALAYYF